MHRKLTASALLGILLASSCTAGYAAEPAPMFRDFPASSVRKGPGIQPVLDTPAKEKARAEIAKGVSKGPNFGGQYRVVTWECGSGCRAGVVADLGTGRVTDLPSDEDFRLDDLRFRPDSTLLVSTNRSHTPADEARRPTWSFYAFDGREFVLMHKLVEPTKHWSDFPSK